MFESNLNEDPERQRVTRRAFLLSGGLAAAAKRPPSPHGLCALRLPCFPPRHPAGPFQRLRSSNSLRPVCPRGRLGCRKSSRAPWTGGVSFPPMPSTSPAERIPRWRIPALTGTCTSAGFFGASAVIRRFFLLKPSSIQVLAGPATGSRSPGKT
jgi:hypothetical protein